MNGRDAILGRIRAALSTRRDGDQGQTAGRDTPRASFRQVLPSPGATYEELRGAFVREATALRANVQVVADRQAEASAVRELARAGGWSSVASHRAPLTDAVCEGLGIPVMRTDGGYDVEDLESCPVGITACDALIALTGSVLLTCRGAGGRALSVLPPHHVVVATRDQILPDLVAGFELLQTRYGQNFPRFTCLVTGPSRTADIERVLVLGAHGPARLTILLIEDGPDGRGQ